MLAVVERRVSSRPGAGGLRTLRLDIVYRASGGGRELAFVDEAFPGRIGWREVTVAARDGARVLETSAPATSESNVLRAYPKDLLRSPLDVSSAVASFEPGDVAGAPPVLTTAAAPKHTGGGFEALIEQGDLSFGVLLLSFLVAAFWGAAPNFPPEAVQS